MENQAPYQPRIRTFLEMVKFSHTVFALPFALLAALLAANGLPSLWKILWIIVAMAGARTGAMGANRLLDAKIDARNPRTRNRALPTGQINPRQALLMTGVSYLIFIFAAAMLNPLCLHLAPYVIMLLTAYSAAKRYTIYTHYILGLCLGLAPIGAWIAISGTLALTPLILALAVGSWVSGFDLLYSLQDIEFDQQEGLHSIPASIGVVKTMALARKLHLGMLGGLFFVYLISPSLGWLFLLALLAVAALLHYEHEILSPTDLSKIDTAFFTINGYISIILFVIAALDIFAG
ncbi:MAG: UbiA family prenyltransferase [Deltaproteobacteria bacterium]|nr:UbiA family prenyltransferase [Deltaproteobacteria bacterium]